MESQNGLGRYTQYLEREDFLVLAKYGFYHSIFVMLGISAVKLSMGFLFLRITQDNFRRFVIGMINEQVFFVKSLSRYD
jgi:hypothetical protein